MAFYNLGAGGDLINNPNYALYPQNAYIDGIAGTGNSLLRPAEHMAPGAYNIWRNVHFGEEKNPSNMGVRDFMHQLYANGLNLVADDVVGLVTLPHEAIVAGVYYRVEAPQDGTVIQLVNVLDGTDIGAPIDASTSSVGFFGAADGGSFVVPETTNNSVGMKIVEWPLTDDSPTDPCGVYGPCDELTLCITLNVFIWSPVAEWFCKSDPCYGQARSEPHDV